MSRSVILTKWCSAQPIQQAFWWFSGPVGGPGTKPQLRSGVGEQQAASRGASRDTRSIIPLVRCIPPASMMTYDDIWWQLAPSCPVDTHCDPKCNLMTAWCLRFIFLPKLTYVEYIWLLFLLHPTGSCGLHGRGRGRPTERQVGFLGGPRSPSSPSSQQCGRHLRGSHGNICWIGSVNEKYEEESLLNTKYTKYTK